MNAQPLAEFFRSRREAILTRWRGKVRQLDSARQLDHPTLTDHIPHFLDELIADLAQDRSGPLAEEHVKGSPPMHGVQRVADGFEIEEVVVEYHLLHAALIEIALADDFPLEEETRAFLLGRIGEATALSVRAYANHETMERRRRQREHLSFITHDLRTPLGAIALGMEELELSWPDADRAAAEEIFGMLRRNVRRLDALVKRVLQDATQAEEGSAFTPESREFDLWPIVERLLVDFRPLAEKERIAMRNRVPRTLEVFADSGLVAQALQNLLGNAFRFAPGGEIVVAARALEGGAWIECEVRDNGAGIEPERLERVFDKHETDPDQAKKSTGLGLAIVKQIVVAHGGEVRAASTPGAGAAFTFTLPARPGETPG